MKKVNILVACGSGVATSTIAADEVKALCKEHGIHISLNKCSMTELPSMWIWVNTSDTICENFFEIPAGEYLIVSTSGQTKTVWPLIEAMKLKPCGNLAKKM